MREVHQLQLPVPEIESGKRFSAQSLIDLTQFVEGADHGVTRFPEGPLFHTTEKTPNMPLAMRQIVVVNDPISGARVPFDIITKGVTLSYDGITPPRERNPFMQEDVATAIAQAEGEIRRARGDKQPFPVTIMTDSEDDYLFSSEGRDKWEKAVLGEQKGIVIALRTLERLGPDHKNVFLPSDLPDPDAIRRCLGVLNERLSLDMQESVEKLTIPDLSEKGSGIRLGDFTMHPERMLKTPWKEEPVHVTRFTYQSPDGRVETVKLVTTKGILEVLADEAKRDGVDTDSLDVGIERFCPCMRGRKGCDCYKQMEKRLTGILAKDGVFVFLPTDPAMGWGEVVADWEHRRRAQIDGLINTGIVPHTQNLDVRSDVWTKMFGKDVPLDITDYNPGVRLLSFLFGPRDHYRLHSENKLKRQALETLGPVEFVSLELDDEALQHAGIHADSFYDAKRRAGKGTYQGPRYARAH